MSEILRAEWTKLRTLASTVWLLVGAVALSIAISTAVLAATHVSSGVRPDPTKLALTGVDLGQAMIVVLAVLAISEEYATGMIHITLVAAPRRLGLLAAKAANVGCLTLLAGLLAVAGCLVAGRLTPAHGHGLVSFDYSPTLRAAAGSVLYLALIALLSLGIATAIRDTAVSIGVTLGLLYLPPILAAALSEPLRGHVEQVAPMSAGLAIQATTNLGALPIAPWPGIGVLAAWAAAALVGGGLLFRLRDA